MKGRIVAVAAALAAVAVLVVVAGAQGGGSGSGSLAWKGAPQVFTPPTLPRDRVMSARLRNGSLEPVDLAAADIRLLDAGGRPVQSTARFLETYVHGLFPPSQRPATPNPNEQRQLGEIATLRPGADAALTLSWRIPEGGAPPVRADFGAGRTLPLP